MLNERAGKQSCTSYSVCVSHPHLEYRSDPKYNNSYNTDIFRLIWVKRELYSGYAKSYESHLQSDVLNLI